MHLSGRGRALMCAGLLDLTSTEVPCCRPQRMMMMSAILPYFCASSWMTGCCTRGTPGVSQHSRPLRQAAATDDVSGPAVGESLPCRASHRAPSGIAACPSICGCGGGCGRGAQVCAPDFMGCVHANAQAMPRRPAGPLSENSPTPPVKEINRILIHPGTHRGAGRRAPDDGLGRRPGRAHGAVGRHVDALAAAVLDQGIVAPERVHLQGTPASQRRYADGQSRRRAGKLLLRGQLSCPPAWPRGLLEQSVTILAGRPWPRSRSIAPRPG